MKINLWNKGYVTDEVSSVPILEANLNELTSAHDRLYEQGKQLDKLNNAKNTWLNLLRKYEESKESLFKYSTRFNEVNNYCIKKLETYDIEESKLKEPLINLEREYQAKNKELTKLIKADGFTNITQAIGADRRK